MARLSQTKIRGTDVWRVVWNDATKGAGKAGERKMKCNGGDHAEALKAAVAAEELTPAQTVIAANPGNRESRELLRRAYDVLEVNRYRDATEAAAIGHGPAFETPVSNVVALFRRVIDRREQIGRGEHPAPLAVAGLRAAVTERGLSKGGAYLARQALSLFEAALPVGLTTGQLSGGDVAQAAAKIRADRGWHPATVNRWRTAIAGLFALFTNREAKRLFRDRPADWFADDAPPLPTPTNTIEINGAAELTRFLQAAERWADPALTFAVKRRKGRGPVEHFEQRRAVEPAPVLQWALLLATTGVRRSEAARMRWADVDFEAGTATVFSTKTNKTRTVRLVGDPCGDVSPGIVAVLNAWRDRRPDAVFVLPGGDETTPPSFPKHAWARVAELAGTPNVSPQSLRRTWESGLAALGFPAAIAAFMAGHGVAVAERFYRAFAVGRHAGATLDDALGLKPFLDREARGQAVLRLLPKTGTSE